MLQQSGYIECLYCHAMQYGEPPHGVGVPCPHKLEMDRVTREKLETDKAYATGAGLNNADITKIMEDAMKLLTGRGGDE